MNGTRIARNTSAAAVAGIAAWSSYSHMVHVALRYGERAEVAYALPLSVDGMLIVASAAMVDDRRAGRKIRPVARIAFAAGVVASVAANVCAAHPALGARIVAAWPALALLLVVEMLSRSGRPAEQPVTPGAEDARDLPAELPPIPSVRRPATAVTTAWTTPAARSAEPVAAAVSSRQVPPGQRRQPPPATCAPVRSGAPAEVEPSPPHAMADPAEHWVARSGRHSAEVPPQPALSGPTRSAARRPPDATDRAARSGSRRRPTEVTRQLANQIMAAQPHLTRGEIADRLGVSTRRLREVLATQS